MRHFRRAIVAGSIVAANAFLWWIVPAFRLTLYELRGWVALVLAAAGPIGAYWMLYDCFRYEKKFWRHFAWAIIPYFFIWHYFERVRRRGPSERAPIRSIRGPLPDKTGDSEMYPPGGRWHRKLGWTLLLLATTAFTLWCQFGPWWPKGGLESAFVTLFFLVQPLGALWMLYRSVRFEGRPLLFILLAFVPYAFLWYYFERVRKTGSNKSPNGVHPQIPAGD